MPQDFIEEVEQEALPKRRGIRTLQDYLEFWQGEGWFELKDFWGPQLLISIALGDRVPRFQIVREPVIPVVQEMNDRKVGLTNRLREQGAALAVTDRLTLVQLLREREAYTVEELNLGSVWEWTPFPIELNADDGELS